MLCGHASVTKTKEITRKASPLHSALDLSVQLQNQHKMAIQLNSWPFVPPRRGLCQARQKSTYSKDKNGFDTVIGCRKEPVLGTPDIDLVSTSYVERANLTIRMGNSRFMRLKNAFSKKTENHYHMLRGVVHELHAASIPRSKQRQHKRRAPRITIGLWTK